MNLITNFTHGFISIIQAGPILLSFLGVLFLTINCASTTAETAHEDAHRTLRAFMNIGFGVGISYAFSLDLRPHLVVIIVTCVVLLAFAGYFLSYWTQPEAKRKAAILCSATGSLVCLGYLLWHAQPLF